MVISLSGRSIPPSEFSSTISTSATARACTPGAPPKMTSCIEDPRTARGDCSPIAHRTASVMFDLPEPLGPTTTLTPGPKTSCVRSGKDLKPFSVSDFSCTCPLLPERLDGDPRRLLLGLLLAAPAPGSERPAVDDRRDRERALVRRALLVGHPVPHLRATAREQLLQRGLEVHRVLQRLLDLGREGLHDCLGRALVP